MAHTAQERYSNLVDLKLRATLVKRNGIICNTRYEGSPKAGAVKVSVRDTEVAVADYNKKTGSTMTSGDTTYLTVTIDKDKVVNELIDGFDAASVPDNLVADRLDSAGYSLAMQMEQDASTELTTSGTAFGTTTALTEKTIYANIVDARTKMSETNIPTEGRWLLVAPSTYALLLKSPEFIKASDLGDAVVQTGAVGRIAGFTVFEDNTLGENVEYIAGHPNWFTRIEEWAVPVAVNDLKGSGTYIGASGALGGFVGTGLGKMNADIETGAAKAAMADLATDAAAGSVSDKTAKQFMPGEDNATNRNMLEDTYGVQLPDTEAGTRQVLDALASLGSDGLQQRAQQVTEYREQQKAAAQAEENGTAAETPPAPAEESRTEAAAEEAMTPEEAEQLYNVTGGAMGERAAAQAQENGTESRTAETAETRSQTEASPVERTGESVESTPMRETVGLREAPTQEQQQSQVQRELQHWDVSDKAAETITSNLPAGADAARYAAAASTMYRLGQMNDVKTFEAALELAGSSSGIAQNVNYTLAQTGGRNALEIAYLQGRGEVETGTARTGQLGGALSEASTKGSGKVKYEGTLTRTDSDVGTQIISLNAAATGTDAVLKNVLRDAAGKANSGVRAYIDTTTATIYFADSASDTFGTALHENYHWYNALDAEGAQQLLDHALQYLAKTAGYESVDEMIHAKMRDYADQHLTYNEAAEELVGDAWRGIFSTEEDFKRWVAFQRGQAEKNAGKSGTIHRVMTAIKDMLGSIISRAKEVLTADPDNRAALKAQRLAEAQRRALQDEYFAHAEKAMDNLRSAKENAASLAKSEEAAGRGERYQLDERFENEVDKIDLNATWSKRIRVGSTSEVLQSIGVKNQSIYWDSGKIRKILTKHSAERFAAGADDSIMTKDIIKQVPQVLENPVIVLHSDIGQNADYASRIYMFGEVYDKTGKPVDVSLELLPTNNKGLEMDNIMVTSAYGKRNVQGLLNRDQILYVDPNKKRTDTWLADNRLQLPLRITKYGPIASLRYDNGNVKSVSAAAEDGAMSIRYQLAEQADRDAKANVQQQASRAIANKAAAFDTLQQFFGIMRGVRISQDSLDALALRWTKTNGSRADRVKLAAEAKALAEYLKADGADMAKAQSLAETLAGEVLDGATYKNTELWTQYPELHELSYTVDKDGKAKAELVRAYGSWSEAVAEARRHGVKLRQEAGHRDGNPIELYESAVSNDGDLNGAAPLFREAAKQAGIEGAGSMESSEWLQVLMNLHDSIKPKMMSRFEDASQYEDAKVELAGRMIGDIMAAPEMTDAQAVFEGIRNYTNQVADMAAGSSERAAEVRRELRGVQRDQAKEFDRRVKKSQHTAQKDRLVQNWTKNNPDAAGSGFKTSGDVAEKLTVLRENYERRLKQENARMRAERQEMLDEISLENQKLRAQNDILAHDVAREQMRADYAERQLIVQDQEIADWEAENQRRAAEWEDKQAQRDAAAQALWDEYADKAQQTAFDAAANAKRLAEKRVERARDGRKQDELKRGIRRDAAALNQLLLRPQKDRYVQQGLIAGAARVAELANMVTSNERARARLSDLRSSMETAGDGMADVWEDSGVTKLIQTLENSLSDSRKERIARLKTQQEEAKALPDSEKARALQERLARRLREAENESRPVYWTTDQLRLLKAVTNATLHGIRTANKTVSEAKSQEIDAIAEKAGREVLASKGSRPGEKLSGVRRALTKYQLDMLGGERVFRMLGGYARDGQMQHLAEMLNDGQRRQTEIIVQGEKLFDAVTGKANRKNMSDFAGPGAQLVDIGLKDTKNKPVPLNHAQLCSLYMHLQNEDSRRHLLNGGLTLPDAKLYNKGAVEEAYQAGQTVQIGMLMNADGTPMADNILQTVENALTDYDRQWCSTMKEFFGNYTANLINETSMKLLGFARATEKNYYPISVDRSQLATEIEGVKLDGTIEGRGFLKERKASSKPILLEECSSVVQRSLRDTAAYAGLAAPVRDVNRVMNSSVETADGCAERSRAWRQGWKPTRKRTTRKRGRGWRTSVRSCTRWNTAAWQR